LVSVSEIAGADVDADKKETTVTAAPRNDLCRRVTAAEDLFGISPERAATHQPRALPHKH